MAQISNDCIVIFYNLIPLILTCIIAKHRGSFIINNEFQGKISLWTPMSPFHKKVNCQVCEISHSRPLKCAKEIVDKEGKGRIIKKLNNKINSQRKFPFLPVMIMKLKEQSHKRFIVPMESLNKPRKPRCKSLSVPISHITKSQSEGTTLKEVCWPSSLICNLDGGRSKHKHEGNCASRRFFQGKISPFRN